MKASLRTLALAALAAAAATTPAAAHHVMGGVMPTTFMQGLLSGLGHPVIGVDHLAAILGVGALTAFLGRGLAPTLAFTAAMIGGAALHLASADIPVAELLVGLSTALIGLTLALRFSAGITALATLFAAAGLVHGYALAESMVGAEPAPLGAYLAGLMIIQTVVAALSYWATRALIGEASPRRAVAMTAAGLAIATVGGVSAALASGLLG